MMKHRNRLMLLLTICIAGSTCARPKSAGAVFSPGGTMISYQSYVSERSFVNFLIGVEYGAMLLEQTSRPGINAGVGYNFIFRQRDSRSGTSVWYAGPAVSLGYMADKDKFHGMIFCFSGVIGYEYSFHLPVSLSVDLAPTLGLSFHNVDENLQLSPYINGFIWSLVPWIGIKYRF